MTNEVAKPSRRVLLGVSEEREMPLAMDIAIALASGLDVPLQCLLVEHEDLLAVSQLPFARVIGPGGMSLPLTPAGVESYFGRLAQLVERELIARCGRFDVAWDLARPHGNFVNELTAAIMAGDVVVVNRKDVHAAPERLLGAIGLMLATASAVVIPSATLRRGGVVIAVTNHPVNGARKLADEIGKALKRRVEYVTAAALHAVKPTTAVIVAPIGTAEAIGPSVFMHIAAAIDAAVVLVPNGPEAG